MSKSWKSQLHTAKACKPRGGATLFNAENKILIFGGVNRDQEHFSDLYVCKKSDAGDPLVWETATSTGDIPTARSGHAVCGLGKYMFLSGGIDFTEEVVYNDVYVLNTETLVWSYVGEKGEDIAGRNSHSLHIISISTTESTQQNISCLVLYGGASPEHGPFSDVYYATLPSVADDIDQTEFFVEWCKLHTPTTASEQPGAREMHSSCSFGDSIVVCGGRDEQGILADSWLLCGKYKNNAVDLTWHRAPQMDLPIGRCSHSMTMVSSSNSNNPSIYIFGGFSADTSISNELIRHVYNPTLDLLGGSSNTAGSSNSWQVIHYPTKIQERFGSCLCEAPVWYIDALSKPSTVFTSTAETCNREDQQAVILFGGVNVNNDLADVWLISNF